nr:hypothetical protein CFP56_13821 [Quercus suber]
MTMQAMQAAGRKFQIEKQMGSRDLSQVYSLPSTDISNVPKPSVIAGMNPHPTWKRLARLSASSQVSVEDSIGVKRPVDMDPHQQIREIDKDLGFNENSINRESAIDTRENMTMQAMQAAGRKFQIEKQMGSRDLSQVYSLPSTDISNVPKPSVIAGMNPHPTWKRLARLSASSQVSVEDSIGVKHPVDMVVDHYELPCKKLVVSCDDKENSSILAEIGSQSRQSK